MFIDNKMRNILTFIVYTEDSFFFVVTVVICLSNTHFGLDVRMRVVADELEVFVLEVEDGLHIGVDEHARQGAWGARELQLGLLEMVQVEVGVARGVDEVARLQARHLRHHLQQERIAGNVERHSEERVSTALVELKRESTIGDVELEDGVAGWERHAVDLGHVPSRNNHAA